MAQFCDDQIALVARKFLVMDFSQRSDPFALPGQAAERHGARVIPAPVGGWRVPHAQLDTRVGFRASACVLQRKLRLIFRMNGFQPAKPGIVGPGHAGDFRPSGLGRKHPAVAICGPHDRGDCIQEFSKTGFVVARAV